MIVRSGDRSIVRYSRWFILGLYAVGSALILDAAFFLLLGVYAAHWFAVPAALLAPKLYSLARVFSRGFVAIGPEGVRLGLLKNCGLTWVALREQSFPWEEIGDITYDAAHRVCRFQAGNSRYALTYDNSPSPKTVAKLLAERKSSSHLA
jgi:hypothetical protein